mgnify:CR=1 FL=1
MKYAYIHGIILDGSEDMEPQTNKIIFTDGEKIKKITDENENLEGYELVDLAGHYIMPGLINMHAHLPASGKPQKKQTDTAKLVRILTSNKLTYTVLRLICEDSAKQQLLGGCTTVRTVGGVQHVDSQIRDRIAAGKIVGPRLLSADMAVSVPGGHMAGSLAYEARDPDEAALFVKDLADHGVDFIKLMITGGVLDAKKKGEPGEMKMTPAEIEAACTAAHERGLYVAAHVESPAGVRAALAGGVDSIEHGAEPDEEIIGLFKEKNAFLITTLSPALPYALCDREITHVNDLEFYNGGVVFRGIIDCSKQCLANGIPVGLGTDAGCPFTPQYNMWRELVCFCHFVGVTNKFALYTATKRNAELAGIGDITGTIEAGKAADMIVTAKNPLEDLHALRDLELVTARGKIIEHPVPKRMKLVEDQLDSLDK